MTLAMTMYSGDYSIHNASPSLEDSLAHTNVQSEALNAKPDFKRRVVSPMLLKLSELHLTSSKTHEREIMAGPPKKRQRREDIQDGEMPQKKYYRQRAHANPFSDHDLT